MPNWSYQSSNQSKHSGFMNIIKNKQTNKQTKKQQQNEQKKMEKINPNPEYLVTPELQL